MKKTAFTFIEILIAIFVFAVGIFAVLQVVINNLSLVDDVRRRTTATFLAKEGIELIYNIRNTNKQRNNPRNCIPSMRLFTDRSIQEQSVCEGYMGSGQSTIIQLAFDPTYYLRLKQRSDFATLQEQYQAYRMYYFTGMIGEYPMSWYAYTGERGDISPFARYIRFTGVVENNTILPIDKLLKVSSYVIYTRAGGHVQVVLESFIGNW